MGNTTLSFIALLDDLAYINVIMSSSPVQNPPPSGEEPSIKFISLKEMAKKIACITSDPNIESEEDKIGKIASLLSCQCMTWPNEDSEKTKNSCSSKRGVYRNLPFSFERALRTAEKLSSKENEDDVYAAVREEIINGYQMQENTYNQVVGGVGYICLFLLISTDNFNNCWGKASLIFGALSVLTFVGWVILRMLKPSVEYKKRVFWPLWGFCFFSGVFGWIFAIISRLMT